MFWKRIKTFFPALIVGAGVCLFVITTAFPPLERETTISTDSSTQTQVDQTVLQVDQWFEVTWQSEGVPVADLADELTILRRLSLALHGTIPSLEEIRLYETDPRDQRLRLWCREMLQDSRFGDYFAERIARSFVGTQGEPFLIFRRDRFCNWLSDELQQNRPYNEVIHEIIAGTGLWTGEPATNFITHAVVDDNIDENKLTGKTVRAVLGQRIDCAQCHDHPFADWKQNQFEGLAAYYGQVNFSPFGIDDRPELEYSVEDRETLEERTVPPSVPFGNQWLVENGTRRKQLATWCTHDENRRFSRAVVNRVWALMFGKAFSEGAPYYTRVDDLPDPEPLADDSPGTALDILAASFVESGYDIHQLIETIASLRVFHSSSSTDQDDETVKRQIRHWAVFPLIRLRPEQIVGSVLQSSSLKTIDQNSHLLTRTIKLINEIDFLKEYGDFGADELDQRVSTVPQALLRMNGKLFRESTQPNPFNATPRIAFASGSPDKILETAFLVCLTRRPTRQETQYFLQEWQDQSTGAWPQKTHDLYWILLNSQSFH